MHTCHLKNKQELQTTENFLEKLLKSPPLRVCLCLCGHLALPVHSQVVHLSHVHQFNGVAGQRSSHVTCVGGWGVGIRVE